MLIWKAVEGWPYEVSDCGDVRRLGGARALKQGLNNRGGYRVVSLKDGCRRRCAPVHRLVAEAFIGDVPDDMVVCHRNDNREDNSLANLYVGTQKQNVADAWRNDCFSGTKLDPDRLACSNGHNLSDVGECVYPDGRRWCKRCRADSNRRWKTARRSI